MQPDKKPKLTEKELQEAVKEKGKIIKAGKPINK